MERRRRRIRAVFGFNEGGIEREQIDVGHWFECSSLLRSQIVGGALEK